MPIGDRYGNLVVRWESADRTIYDTDEGVEFEVHGDESRRWLAEKIADSLDDLSARSTHLLVTFMRDSGTFELGSVEVFGAKSEDGNDFSLRYAFAADINPEAYGYTYFDVYFSHRAPPGPEFWPHKFTIGFH